MHLTLDPSLRKLDSRFQQQRTNPQLVRLALALYQQGLSLRQVAKALSRLGSLFHHVTIWRWLQRCSSSLDGQDSQGLLPPVIIANETALRAG